MSATLAKPPAFKGMLSQLIPGENGRAQGVIAWSSFFFTVLQSICTFFAAVDGLRLVIGVGSLAVSAESEQPWTGFTRTGFEYR